MQADNGYGKSTGTTLYFGVRTGYYEDGTLIPSVSLSSLFPPAYHTGRGWAPPAAMTIIFSLLFNFRVSHRTLLPTSFRVAPLGAGPGFPFRLRISFRFAFFPFFSLFFPFPSNDILFPSFTFLFIPFLMPASLYRLSPSSV